jgi:hypothetical protein
MLGLAVVLSILPGALIHVYRLQGARTGWTYWLTTEN